MYETSNDQVNKTAFEMRNRPRNSIKIEGLTLDLTSSLNKFFLCECGRKYKSKVLLARHAAACDGKPVTHFCHWCNLTFNNRGNLVLHAKFIHGDDSYKVIEQQKTKNTRTFKCNVCDAKYPAMWKLKYHIRGTHFNLFAGFPNFESIKVNQVWFEKVLNTTYLVEIHKKGPNTLVMKPLAPGTTVKLTDRQLDKVDLHSVYPTGRRINTDVLCKICKKFFRSRDLKKHIQEAHQKDFAKHTCNNCNMTFKRSYIYLKHVCYKSDGRLKKRDVKGVKQFRKRGITIANVSSLQLVEVD